MIAVSAPASAQTVTDALSAEVLKATAAEIEVRGASAGYESAVMSGPARSLPGTPTPIAGPEVPKVTVIEDGRPVERYWTELRPEVWRALLQNSFVDTSVAIVEKNGSMTYMPFSASIGDKHYVLSFNNFVYKSYPCSARNPMAGELYVGVGIRITADVTSKGRKVGLSLPALALAANTNTIQAHITAEAIGLSGSGALSHTLGDVGGKLTTYESLVAAAGAFQVAYAVLENRGVTATPRVIAYVDRDNSGSCKTAIANAALP